MRKKIFICIISFVVLFSLSVVLIFLLKYKNNEIAQEQIEAINNDVSIVLNVIDKNEFLNQIEENKQLQKFQEILQINNITDKLILIDSIEKNLPLNEFIEFKNIFLAFFIDSTKIEQEIIVKTKNKNDKKLFNEIYKFLNTNENSKISEYNSTKIIEYQNLFFYIKNSLLVICNSQNLSQKAITAQNNIENNLLKSLNFKNAYSSAGKNELANIYINFNEKFNKIFKQNNLINFIAKQQNNWQEYDINISDNTLICNGISFINEENTNPLLSSAIKSENSELNILSMLPKYYNSFSVYKHKKDSNFKNISETLDKILKEIKSEILITKNIKDNFILFDCISSQESEKKILKIIDDFCEKNKIENQTKNIIDIDKQNSIIGIKLPEISNIIYDSIYFPIKAQCCCFYNNYAIFAENPNSLKTFVLDIIRKNTITNDKTYLKFSNHFTKKPNLLYYSNDKNFLYGYEFSKIGKNYYNIFAIDILKNTNDNPVLWQTKLEAEIITNIFAVKNHNNSTTEFIFQDENFNLYLIDERGIELWKKTLYEKIISPISQIDYYDNGKLQYIFSTKNKIYIIDRLGNYVDNYPIPLSSEANTPLSIIKYKDTKNKRLFIPCKDKKIYLFDIKGKVLKDWLSPQTETEILSTIKHFNISGKDYLLTHDKNNIYKFSRKGERKSTFFVEEGISNNEIYFDKSSNELIFSNILGKIIRINSDNKKTSLLSLKNFSETHYFNYIDIDADDENEYFFCDNSNIFAYKKNGKLIFEKEIGSKIKKTLFFENVKSKFFIAIICENGLTYILDNNGKILENFPIPENNSILIIEEAGKFYYYTANKDNLISKNELIF